MVRTAVLGLMISLLPVFAGLAWPEPADALDLAASDATQDWNAPAYDGLWITLSRAEDPNVSINDLLVAADRPLRYAR